MGCVSICVFCGARDGADPAWRAAAAFGTAVAAEGWRLVFGAGDVGLMGAAASAARAAGGATFGVIPAHLVRTEAAQSHAGQMVVTETMHERKKVMFMNSDAIVVLPGGAGTLDEFFEMLTWRQLGLHDKPIVLLDVGGFWAKLRALLDHVVAQGFADPSLLDLVSSAGSASELMGVLRAELRLSRRICE